MDLIFILIDIGSVAGWHRTLRIQRRDNCQLQKNTRASHLNAVGGSVQPGKATHLTAIIELKESEMMTMAPEKTDKSQGLSFPVTADGSARTHIMRVQNGTRTSAYQVQVGGRTTYNSMPENTSADGKYPESMLSKKVLDALAEDPDPAKSLADIRRVLVGPTRQLHEARMEEVLEILEESDQAMQTSLRALENQFANLATVTDKQAMGLEETNRRLDHQAEQLNSELHRSAKTQQDMVSELFLMFDAKLEKVTEQLNQQAAQMNQQDEQLSHKIDGLSKQTTNSIQSLATEFGERIQDVTQATSANDDRIVEQMETRLTRAETYADTENRRHIAAFADGFSELADRVLALRNVQAS